MDMTILELVGLIGFTLVITHGMVFDELRYWLASFTHPMNVFRWLGMLMSCPQCSGFWIGAGFALATRQPWVGVVVAGGLVSIASVVASFAFEFAQAAMKRVTGDERADVIRQLLEARSAKREEARAAQSKAVHGDDLSESDAHALMDEAERHDDAVGGVSV